MTSFLKSVALVVTSHRGVRAGPSVATFVETVLESATKAGNVNLKTVDVKTFNLPVFGESLVPKMMAMQGIEFEDEAPKAWAKEIASHDGYLFLVNEYNGGMSGATKNALDYLWAGFAETSKPVMIVGYGVLGGNKASEQVSAVLSMMGLQVVEPQVHLPWGQGPDGRTAAIEGKIGEDIRQKWESTKSADILAAFEELQNKLKEETPKAKVG